MSDKSKVTMLKGNTTVPVFCAKLMECADEIESIACVVKYKNKDTYVHHTAMPDGDMAWFRWCFDQDFRPSGKVAGLES